MEHIKLFTHTDLDGIGCAILAKMAFNYEGINLSIDYCDYDNVNQKVESFLKSMESDCTIYITDISVNEEVAEKLDKLPNVVLLDHHQTAMWLNKYKWADVTVENRDKDYKESGTSLFYNYLRYNKNITTGYGLAILVEIIRRYDTWEWKNKYNDILPKKLNDLFHLYGRDKFVDEYIKRVTSDKFVLFSEDDEEILKIEELKINKYIYMKSKRLVEVIILGYKAGIVFAEQYFSEMGNKLSELNPHLDFIAMVDMGNRTISYRTINNDIDLGKDVARVFGGGGHPQAARSNISESTIKEIISKLF